MVLLDTDILVGVLRKDEAALEKLKALRQQGESLAITSFTEYELFLGVFESENQEENATQVTNLLNTLGKILFEENAPRIAARVFAELERRGEGIGLVDVLIASIVLAGNDILVTRNKKHFEKIPGLEIEEW